MLMFTPKKIQTVRIEDSERWKMTLGDVNQSMEK